MPLLAVGCFSERRTKMENVETSFFEAISKARRVKKAYEQLNTPWQEAKKVREMRTFDAKKPYVKWWKDIYRVIDISADFTCSEIFEQLTNHYISLRQFDEEIDPQCKQVEEKLKSLSGELKDDCMPEVSKAYDREVSEILEEDGFFKFFFVQEKVKNFIINMFLK